MASVKRELVDLPKATVPLKEQKLQATPIITRSMVDVAYKAVIIKQMQLSEMESENPEYVRYVLVEECIRAALEQRAKELS